MATIGRLRDTDKNTMYPQTVLTAVFRESDGKTLDKILEEIINDIDTLKGNSATE